MKNTEIIFDKKNMNAIQNTTILAETNGCDDNGVSTVTLVNTGNVELDNLTVSLMTCDSLNDRIKAYKAVTLAYIKKNFARLGGKTGCKDVVEYGKKYLNYEKAQVNFLIQVAEKYIALDDTMSGETVPALSEFKYNIIKDADGYTMKIGQLQEIISVDKEKVLEAIESGKIDCTSTQKDLREWKKAVKNTIETTATDSDSDSTATDGDSNNTEDIEKPMTDKERLLAILNIISGIENSEVHNALIKAVEKAEKVLAKT